MSDRMSDCDLVSRKSVIDYLMINMGWHDADGYEVDDWDEKLPIITDLINGVPSCWISVKDRMPDAAGYECLVCAVNENYNQTHVFTAHTGYGEPGWWTSNVHYMSRATSPSDNKLHPALNVTHWMPLPDMPS